MLKRIALICFAAAAAPAFSAPDQPGRGALLTTARSLQRDVDMEIAKASQSQKLAASLSPADGPALQAVCRETLARPADARLRQQFEQLVARNRSTGAEAIVSYCLAPSYQQLRRDVQSTADKLNSVGDDAQLANVDLQNVLQKQQQTLQMMSNISKMLYDTATSVIRKMGG
jgi:hypothetical protein